MSESSYTNVNAECIETHLLIYRLFSNFTPANATYVRKQIDPHLLRCKECRILLLRCFEERKQKFRETGK